jgi:hypothetical protein
LELPFLPDDPALPIQEQEPMLQNEPEEINLQLNLSVPQVSSDSSSSVYAGQSGSISSQVVNVQGPQLNNEDLLIKMDEGE